MKKFINIYEENDEVVLITKEGQERIKFLWYFVVTRDDYDKNFSFIDDLSQANKITFIEHQHEWTKLFVPYLQRDYVIQAVKALMLTYEADLKLWQRYLADKDLELDIDQRILYFDIETSDLKPGIDPGSEQILSIAAMNDKGKEFYSFSMNNEKKVLKDFLKWHNAHDLLVGWHSEGFDLPAISRRCKIHHLDFDCWITEWSAKDMGGLDSVRKAGKLRARPIKFNTMDLMQKIKEMHYRDTELIKKVRSFSLNAVAKAILGKEKVDLKGERIWSLANRDPELLKTYNMQDVKLLYELDKKMQVTKQKLIEHQICNARINDYTSHGKIDPYALRQARLMGTHLPSRPDKEETLINNERRDDDRGKLKGDYAGGYVFEPKKGLWENIYAFDFASLYPSIIKTFNISIDSLITDQQVDLIKLPTGISFSKIKMGIIPQIVQSLLDARDQIRHVEMRKIEKNSEEYMNLHYRQYAFKVLANSMYGVMGASFSRYYKRELAEGITLTGQHLIKKVWKWIEDEGHAPIYGDTDSVYIKLKKGTDPELYAKQIDRDLQKYLVATFNANPGHLHLAFEAEYKRFLMIAKKKYIGLTKTNEMKTTGLELKKRDTLPLAEKWQRELIDNLLLKNLSLQDYVNWAKEKRDFILKGMVSKEDLIFQKRLSKEIENYGGTNKLGRKLPIPRHVKIAAELKEKSGASFEKLNLYSTGAYIPYIILNEKKKEVIHPDSFKGSFDKDYYVNACFDPSKRVLEAIYPTVDWESLKQEYVQTTLF